MVNMTDFFTVVLTTIAYFLRRDPVIYLIAIICLSKLIKVFRQLLP